MIGPLAVLTIATGMAAAWQGSAAVPVQEPAAALDRSYGCVSCHADKRRSFVAGIHSDRGIRCHDCHGGDPAAFEEAPAHRQPFIGAPDKRATIDLCTSCHADPVQMRQYALPTDQLSEFRLSRHGEALLGRNDTNAPTCTDCHDAHLILPRDDLRSSLYPTNIASTCGACHQDASLMAQYGLPVDQFDQFRAGAHGEAVFEEHNLAAPTCVGCHGSHAALPPTVTEVSRVCDRCHVLLRRSFYEGPHGAPALAGEFPGCVACHSNHGVEAVAPEAIADNCAECHAAGTEPAAVGLEMQEQIVQAQTDMRLAEEAIVHLERAGRDAADARFRYQTALTAYEQIGQEQHRLDPAALEVLTLRVGSISRDIRGAAEAAAETQWEHKLLLVPVWFLALGFAALAWFKLHDLRREEASG